MPVSCLGQSPRLHAQEPIAKKSNALVNKHSILLLGCFLTNLQYDEHHCQGTHVVALCVST